MKKRNPYLGTVLAIGIVLVIMFTGLNKSFDPIREYIPVLWILSIIWKIYLSLKHHSRKSSDQLRIPTNNDEYYRIMPFIFGIILPIGGFFALKYMESNEIFWSLIIGTGILLLISGFLFIPSGIIKISKNELTFENGARKQTIGIEKLNNIDLKSNYIILNEKNKKKHSVRHLNLNESDYQKISEFLNKKLKNKVEIKTYGNTV
jgi:hypothetical protein